MKRDLRERSFKIYSKDVRISLQSSRFQRLQHLLGFVDRTSYASEPRKSEDFISFNSLNTIK